MGLKEDQQAQAQAIESAKSKVRVAETKRSMIMVAVRYR